MKVLYVSTLSSTINAFLVEHIKQLNKNGHQIDIAANFNKEIAPELKSIIGNTFNVSFNRSPFSFDNYKAYKEIRKISNKHNYDIIHLHTPVASFITRLAARNCKSKIFYTAHGFHFHRKSSILSWLIYYPLERYLSKYTHTLIVINWEDYELAKKKFFQKRLVHINGVGFDRDKYIVNTKKFNSNKVNFVSVGEVNKNKNHVRVIKALLKIKFDYSYTIVGTGKLECKLKRLINKYKLNDKIKLLGYREDINTILLEADIFIFPSLREGLGIAAIEAMASGLPILTSNVHGINDYSAEEISGFKFNPKNVSDIAHKIEKIINNKDNWISYSNNNIRESEKYDIKLILNEIIKIYDV
ncbi:similar to capsular polysaccharide biosynthesis protein [Paracholeplasma brassicae]|uniref:Similar to capsular polysaccharide biosynthesis protein n=1 Tax=Acholeplasma brassicae TaxID=61635 RepID=U4KM13_9MOLU|nr:glycosyltransferase family 4 protein [Paracholeplasma brassicae]CCV65102.1 similar to capsular polysaccharide biosynthesis protein [Paracholeplasma brassicae]